MKLYRRDLAITPQDEMHLEVDHYLTPTELSEEVKIHLTQFIDFLLKNGYCDTDVYAEPPTAIDQYLAKIKES